MGRASPQPGIRPLRAAIVGCGRISAIHIEALRALPSVDIVAVCDANGDLARKRALQAGIEGVFTDLEVMMRTVRPDVVHILTPPRTHLALTETAVAHQAHVYVEKPFASPATDGRKLVAAAIRT